MRRRRGHRCARGRSSVRSSWSSACSTACICGHAYLLDHLVAEAGRRATTADRDHVRSSSRRGPARDRAGRSCSIPQERLERLEAAGVDGHGRPALRRCPASDARTTRSSNGSASAADARPALLMTPDAAFGFERRGTPATLAALGARDGFEVVVVPPFTTRRAEVRSSDDPGRDRRRRPRGRVAAARTAGDDHGLDRRRSMAAPGSTSPARRAPARR